MKRFAVLQLSGCAGCEVSLLDAEAWLHEFKLEYMPLVVSAHEVPEVETLLISGGVRTEVDLWNLRKAVRRAQRVVAVGTCALSGGVAHLGDRDEIRQMFLAAPARQHVPHLLPRSRPVDAFVKVDCYLPGCPPTPRLFLDVLHQRPRRELPATVCVECGRKKLKDLRPTHLEVQPRVAVRPDVCLINQGYLCVGSSTRGGCDALCTRPGHACVGCRGPSDAFIEKESKAWFTAISRVFTAMTDVPPAEVEAMLHSPQMALFLYQFSDYDGARGPARTKDQVL